MIDKTKLAERIRQLGGLTAEEKSSLLALLHEQKRYGLIWEEKPEEVKSAEKKPAEEPKHELKQETAKGCAALEGFTNMETA